MTDTAKGSKGVPELVAAVWEEARDLIKRLEGSSVQRLSVEAGDTRIEIERGVASGPPGAFVAAPAAAPASVDGASAAADESKHAITSPLVGTFYGAPQPGADPFVKVGDVVEPGQTVAIVEAMKLMNQVQADVRGTVAAILADDGQWVEFEQALVLLDTDDGEGDDD